MDLAAPEGNVTGNTHFFSNMPNSTVNQTVYKESGAGMIGHLGSFRGGNCVFGYKAMGIMVAVLGMAL
jgi:hypothetical protein